MWREHFIEYQEFFVYNIKIRECRTARQVRA